MKSTKSITRVRNQTVISRLFSIGTINADQFLAARKLQAQHYYADCAHTLKSKFVVTLGSKVKRPTGYEDQLYAKRNLEHAMGELNDEERSIVEWTIIKDEYLKYYCDVKSKENHIPTMSKVAYKKYVYRILCHALDKLAKNYDNN